MLAPPGYAKITSTPCRTNASTNISAPLMVCVSVCSFGAVANVLDLYLQKQETGVATKPVAVLSFSTPNALNWFNLSLSNRLNDYESSFSRHFRLVSGGGNRRRKLHSTPN